MRRLALALALALAVPAAAAVTPSEMFEDPALEARAQDIMGELRCVVCRSESILESNADIARDLRVMVRERIAAGDTDAEVIDFVVARYGEFVLFRPRFSWGNAALWLSGPAFLLLGGGLALAFVRSRARTAGPAPAPLTPEEEARLKRVLGR